MFRSTAHVYDLVYSTKDYEAEARAVKLAIQSRNPSARTLLDVACGTGGHLAYLRHDFDVAGVDVDPGMLSIARERLPGVALYEGDMRTLDVGQRFDAVVCLFSSIGYMQTNEQLEMAIGAMANHLHSPGGVLVVDGWIRPEAWREPGSLPAEAVRGDDVSVGRVGRTWREGRTAHLELHHLVATPDRVDHLVDHHELTLFSHDDYRTAFERAGLSVEVTGSPYDDRDRYIAVR